MSLPVVFVDYSASAVQARHEAEIYMRIYQYAAEDFRSNKDCFTCHQGVFKWEASVEQRLTELGVKLVSHFHMVPQAPSGTLPSLPTTIDLSWKLKPPAKIPISTTLVVENMQQNYVVPAANLTYVNLSMKGARVPVQTFRRGKMIPIATGITSGLIKL